MKVKIIRSCFVEGDVLSVGEVVSMSVLMAQTLIGGGKAEPASDDGDAKPARKRAPRADKSEVEQEA